MKSSADFCLMILFSSCLGCGIGPQLFVCNDRPNYGDENKVGFDNNNDFIVPYIGNNIKSVFVEGVAYTNFNNLRETKIEELTIRCRNNNLRGTDLSFINTLRNLKILTLEEFRLTDIAFLEGLPLTEITLVIYGDEPLSLGKVKSMDSLKGCPLKYVDLRYFELDNLDFLAGSPLETLLLSNSRLLRPPDLIAFTNLTTLHAPESGIDIRSIPKSVTHLDLGYCEVAHNIEGLSSFSRLEYLSLPYQVTNLSFCTGLPLRELWADHCRVEDLSPLLNVPLEVVNVVGTKVSDILPVRHARTVFANASQVVSLNGMEPCRIECLSINECPIKSLKGIESFRKLEYIEFNDTAIKDIWRLKNIPTLQNVRFTSVDGARVNLFRSETNSPFWGEVFSK